jgi:Cdc6-like AAA superfamily ATPase
MCRGAYDRGEAMAADGVIGREEELAAVAALLDRSVEAWAALSLTGEAGVGKTTLWRAGIEEARQRCFRVLVASPAEAEAAMSFAAVGDLFAGVVDEVLLRLPPPQRRALEVALLLAEAEGPEADLRAVGVAFLNGFERSAPRGLSLSRSMMPVARRCLGERPRLCGAAAARGAGRPMQ